MLGFCVRCCGMLQVCAWPAMPSMEKGGVGKEGLIIQWYRRDLCAAPTTGKIQAREAVSVLSHSQSHVYWIQTQKWVLEGAPPACMRARMSLQGFQKLPEPLPSMTGCAVGMQDVCEVVDTCHEAGISRKCIKLRPIGVVKG